MPDTLLALGIRVNKSGMASTSTELSLAEELESEPSAIGVYKVERTLGWGPLEGHLNQSLSQGRLLEEDNI